MLRFILLLTAGAALAQTELPMKLDTEITRGPVTVQCSRFDFSSWGYPFALSPPSFRCNVSTTSPDTTFFAVTIRTRDAAGTVHTYTQDRSEAERGRTVVVFPTPDAVLLSVSVSEVKPPVLFDSSS